MTKSENFEDLVMDIALRHHSGLYPDNVLNEEVWKERVNNNFEDGVIFYIPEIREMLCDMYERAYEEGYTNAQKVLEPEE